MNADFHRRLAAHARLPFVDEPRPATSVLSIAAARAFRVVPIADDGVTLTVATADPARLDRAALCALARRRVRLAVSSDTAIERALFRAIQ
jgi:Type II secretion system (T2SS), protein E, N-terminal domain